jgi:hypothetical protein
MDFLDNCAWCEHPKTAGPLCSNCGADYTKAEAIKQYGKVQSDSAAAGSERVVDTGYAIETVNRAVEIEDPFLEKKLCIITIPAMLAVGFLVQLTGFFSSLQRIVFTMPVH